MFIRQFIQLSAFGDSNLKFLYKNSEFVEASNFLFTNFRLTLTKE